MALDVNAMWDYDRPAVSEQRFREALAVGRGDDALILRTQIARTYSLRGLFEQAHSELDAIEPLLKEAGAESRVRALLERGRTMRSSRRPAEARPLFIRALEQAEAAGLEFLTADALHMVALVETSTEGQVEWNRRLIDQARAATDPRARTWEAQGFNNLGVSLNEAGRHEEALTAFKEALVAHQRKGDAQQIRIAHWMVANTLRRLKRYDEALAIQLDLETQCQAAGQPDPYVFEELAALYEAKGDAAKAAHYRALAPPGKGG